MNLSGKSRLAPKSRSSSLLVAALKRKLVQFGSVCMNLNSVISRRQRRRMLLPIQSFCAWVQFWALVTPMPEQNSAVRTWGLEAEGMMAGTWYVAVSSARRLRNREPISASRM